MNAAQRLEAAMHKVENSSMALIRAAFETHNDSQAWKLSDLLALARAYDNAMRYLARVSRAGK